MFTLFVKNLVKSYKGRLIVNSVSLKVMSGEIVGLLGPNGAGKTTTFYMIIGVIKPDSGEVYLNNKNLIKYPIHLRARCGLTYLPQESSIFSKLTVEQNLKIILDFLPISYKEKQKKIFELLSELGIIDLIDMPASVLSGGERRRLEIARILITTPKVVLLDEPFAGVDPMAIMDIVKIIKHLKNKKIGVLISDHNVKETLSICDKAFILNKGIVVETGTIDRIINSQIVRKVYLGNNFEL